MTHHFPIRVYYEDTDFSGFVYHANYLKFCERARSDMIRNAGVDQNGMFAVGQAIVIRRMNCEFLRPAKFDDVLEVTTDNYRIEGIRLEMRQRVLRGEELLFSAEVTAVIIDARGRPIRVPNEIAARFGAARQA